MSGKKSKNKFKISKAVYVGVGLIVLGIIGFAVFTVLSDKTSSEMAGYKAVTSEAMLREQLQSKPAVCKLTDMVLTGDTCNDESGILSGDYIAIRYIKNVYDYDEVYSEDTNDYDYIYKWKDAACEWENQKADKLVLFGDIKVEKCDYEVSMYGLSELDSKVNKDYAELISNDYYYPDGVSETLGNVRYSFNALPVNSKVAFMATVGNGKVVPVGYKDNAPIFYANGTEEDLSYEMGGEGQGALGAFILFVAIPGGIILIIVGIVRSIKKSLGKD